MDILCQTDEGALEWKAHRSFFNYISMEPAMFSELVQCTWDILAGFEVACHVDFPSNETSMFRMLIECRKNI